MINKNKYLFIFWVIASFSSCAQSQEENNQQVEPAVIENNAQ